MHDYTRNRLRQLVDERRALLAQPNQNRARIAEAHAELVLMFEILELFEVKPAAMELIFGADLASSLYHDLYGAPATQQTTVDPEEVDAGEDQTAPPAWTDAPVEWGDGYPLDLHLHLPHRPRNGKVRL